EMRRIAAVFRHAAFEILVKRLALLQRMQRGEDQLGKTGGKFLAGVRYAGIRNHRVTLRAARHVQRAAHLEKLPLVIEVVEFLRVEIERRLAVADKGVVVPTVPQA